MTITCFIRYEIDPCKKDQFTANAENWVRIIPAWMGICWATLYRTRAAATRRVVPAGELRALLGL